MAALLPLSQKNYDLQSGNHFTVIEVNYLAQNDTVAVDPAFYNSGTALGAAVHLSGGTAPTIDIPSAPSGGTVNVRIGNSTAGTTGKILVVLFALGQNTSL